MTILACIIVILEILILTFVLSRNVLRISPHNGIFLFGFLYYMIVFPVCYLLGLVDGVFYDQTLFAASCFYSLVGLICYIAGVKLTLRHGFKRYYVDSSVLLNSFRVGLVFLCLTGLLVVFFRSSGYINEAIIIFIALMLFINTRMGNIAALRSVAFWAAFLLCFFWIINFSSARRDAVSLLAVAYFLLSVSSTTHGSSPVRNSVIFCSAIFGGLYVTLNRSFEFEVVNVGYYFDRVVDHYLGLMQALYALGDFATSYDNYLRVIDSGTYIHGDSLFRVFAIFIPRVFWPEKPLDVQTLIVERSIVQNTFTGGTSQGMTLIGELYWNFGLFSLAVGMFIFGRLVRYLDSMLHKERKTTYLFSVSMLPFSFVSWRGAFTTSLIYCVLTSLVLLVAFFAEKSLTGMRRVSLRARR